jgi:hypothetical protein
MSAMFNDRGPFKVGEVCVVTGSETQPRFNGCEATILSVHHDEIYVVDVKHPDGGQWLARERRLRRKRPPTTGEQSILALFDAPPVERRQPVTAWQAQFDTAQALMTMGVRVKPGKWPVEVA